MAFHVGGIGAVLTLCGIWSACSRKADIYDEPTSAVTATPTGAPLDGGLTEVTGAFTDPSQPACAQRPEAQDCRSSNDFPCNFDALIEAVADDCKFASGCTANGWFAAELGDDGCATKLEMSAMNSRFVECAVQRLSSVRCPCGKSRSQIFLGMGNDGCPDGGGSCLTGEFPCESGEVCVGGRCEPVGSGGAAP